MRVKWIVLFVGALAMALGACGTTTPTNDELNQSQDPIINGELPDEPMHDAVVSLHKRVGDSYYINIYCSGTLIAPDVVLTAAHCLDEGRNKFNPIEPEEVWVYVGDNPVVESDNIEVFWDHVYDVTEVQAHPSYNNRALTDDIGLLRLASSPPVTPVAALPASLGLTSADEGATINFAGFGENEDGEYDQKLQIDGVLDHLYSAFQIYYYQYEGGPCFGDSGGPAFIKRNGTPYVAGLTSYGDSTCATYGVSTRPDYYTNWINDFIGVVVDPFCGDGSCNAGETCETCEADCGACPPVCGDGTCEGNEDCETCAADCGPCPVSYCGDGTCDADEDCNSCEADCGPCEPCAAFGEYCDTGADCCSGSCHPRKHYCR
jgi:secreted trypsin-like serine protease